MAESPIPPVGGNDKGLEEDSKSGYHTDEAPNFDDMEPEEDARSATDEIYGKLTWFWNFEELSELITLKWCCRNEICKIYSKK